jgi:hypothetical protein
MRLRLSILAAALALALPATALAAHPGEPGIRPSRTPWDVSEAADSPDCGPHFCVHWAATGIDAPSRADLNHDGIPDFVERVLAVAENVHHVENEVLGWPAPLGDGTSGGGHDKTDIYLTELAGEQVFGYTATDPAESGLEGAPTQRSAYLVLDNDYSRFDYPGTKPGRDLKVTLAHEYDHVLQYGIAAEDVERDPWFAESSAVWMEDQVYNGINDYLRYVRRWVGTGKRTGMWKRPLTQGSMKEYGSAVWNEWLAHHFGRPIIRGGLGRRRHRAAVRICRRRLRRGDPRRRRFDLRPRIHPLRRRCRRVADRDRLPRELSLPRHAAAGDADPGRSAADAAAQPHHVYADPRPRDGRERGRSPRHGAGRGRGRAGAGRALRLRP